MTFNQCYLIIKLMHIFNNIRKKLDNCGRPKNCIKMSNNMLTRLSLYMNFIYSIFFFEAYHYLKFSIVNERNTMYNVGCRPVAVGHQSDSGDLKQFAIIWPKLQTFD
jgi:hypothetical protein